MALSINTTDDRFVNILYGHVRFIVVSKCVCVSNREIGARSVGFSLNGVQLEVLFVEVVGGPNVYEAAKEPQDRETLVKVLAVSVDIQSQLASSTGGIFNDKIFAGGILVHGRRVSLLMGARQSWRQNPTGCERNDRNAEMPIP